MSRTRRISLKKRYTFSGKRTRNVGGNTTLATDMITRGTHGDMVTSGRMVAVHTDMCTTTGTPVARNGQPLPIVLTPSAYAAVVAPDADMDAAQMSLLHLISEFVRALRKHTGPRTGVLDFTPWSALGRRLPAFRAVVTGRTIAITLPPAR